jgi:hypothetical protein
MNEKAAVGKGETLWISQITTALRKTLKVDKGLG